MCLLPLKHYLVWKAPIVYRRSPGDDDDDDKQHQRREGQDQ
jgi:hypothetical protein